MNFADEPYVRLYTRKTLTSKLLGWEGRVVLRMMIDEFDAAGIFAIRGDAATCISAVTELPLDIVRIGLERLLETETWVVTGRAITWPTYEEGQNCIRSDRLRQRASRKARAAESVTDVTLAVTPTRPPVTDVTPGHAESRNVTLPPSAPILPSSHPPMSERDARAPEGKPPPDVPGLVVVHPGPLKPSKRDRELDRAASALGKLMHKYPPDFGPTLANQARAVELGLTEPEVWQRWDECRDRRYPSPFDDPVGQFNRELAWAKADKEKCMFKSKSERDAFEMPGRERRAT